MGAPMRASKETWRSFMRRARVPLLIGIAVAVALWDASGWDAPLVGESPFRESGGSGEQAPSEDAVLAEKENAVLGEWEGTLRVPLADGTTFEPYSLRLVISSLEPGEAAGEATTDSATAGHCGGTLTLRGEAEGGYLLDYFEEDNLVGCAASSEILVVPAEGGTLRYRESTPDLVIDGTLARA